jgi:DNA-binding response OmpR family regulator
MTAPTTFSQTDVTVATILVVDDMEANRAVLARRLEKFGYAVISVDSGHAALALIARTIPDIILLDYMMPQMNGIEVLHELRGKQESCEVPVIMVTARAEGEATIEALEAGADDYVTKPIDFDVLRARIETQLAKRKDASQLKRANAALDERVTLRAMALADLEDELKQEIRLRQDLERQLSTPPVSTSTSSGPFVPATVATSPVLAVLLSDMEAKYDSFFLAVTSGRTPNLAQMADFKSLIARCRQAAGG